MFKLFKKSKKTQYKCKSCGSSSKEASECCDGSREKECNCGSGKYSRECCRE